MRMKKKLYTSPSCLVVNIESAEIMALSYWFRIVDEDPLPDDDYDDYDDDGDNMEDLDAKRNYWGRQW